MKQPLFGQDSSPHITSMLISAIATLICWIIFCVLCFVVKFKTAVPEYKEIQIVLSSTPVEEQTATTEQAAAVEQTAVPEVLEGPQVEETTTPEIPKPVETPVAEAKVEAPKETPAPAKTQTAATKTQTKTTNTTTSKTTDPSKKVNFDDYQYAADYSDFSFNNSSSSSSKSSFDWSQFEDTDTENVQVSQKVDKVTNTSSISGSSASASTSNQRQTSSSSSQSNNSTSDGTPGKDVETALDRISKASGNNNSSGTPSGNPNSSTNKTQNFDFSWEGSGKRTPQSSLSIDLGNNTIESTRTVTIKIKVLESGYVDLGSIEIDISSLLTKEIRDSIYDSISKWRFNSSNAVSIATFRYTIQKQ